MDFKPDALDRKLIDLLQENSRLSYAQMGREIGLSPSAVKERIQKLEDEEIITAFTSIVNHKKLGFSLSAYISLSFKDDGFRVFLNILDKFPEITECSRVTGKECLIMKVIVKDSEHLEKLVDQLIPYGAPSTSIILSTVVSNGKIPQAVVSKTENLVRFA